VASEDWGGSTHVCGGIDGRKEELRTVKVEIPHSADFTTISIRAALTEGINQNPWGIRDFTIQALTCTGCKFISREFSEYVG
jgi:hypothetical protein